jgi:hypothetical protein
LQGNAATASYADKLTNVRTIWGQNFNGTTDVTGNMTGVGSITATGDLILNTSGTGTTPALCFQRGTATNSSTDWKFYVASGDTAGALTVERISARTGSVVKLSCNNTDFTVNNNIVATGNVTATKFIGELQGNVTGNLSGIASKVSVGTGSGSTYHAIVVTDGSNGLYTAGTATGKPQYNYSTGDVKAKSFTTDGGSFNGNLTGNAATATSATTATNLANKPALAASGTDSKQITVTAGENTSEPFTVPYATTAGTAAKTAKTLTLKTPAETKTFNGSEDVTFEVTAAKLGLTKAVLYLGITSTALSDGATTNPITIDSKSVTVTNGNIVIDSSNSREYIWNGTKWEKFGLDGDAASGNYKPIQTAVSSPSADGNSTAFIDTISQDANGKITATKKNVNFSGYATTAQLSNYLPLAGGTMNSTAYIAWNNGEDGNDISDWNTITSNGLRIISSTTTNANAPTQYSTALHVKGRYGFQIASRGGESTTFYIRNIDTRSNSWQTLIHSGNIGSQSVASATNATNATTMSSFTAASGDATKRYVWMSWNDNTGKPAYTDKLTFRTSTNTLFVNDTAVSLEGHTHNYAGSSTAGGAATKVVCSAATSNNDRPIVVTNKDNGLYYSTKATLNYSTGIITATNFITTSDRRMKDNITEIVDASKSLELGFYEFDYKTGGHSAGHVAQEVREVLPDFVHGEETETTHLSVDYTGLHSVQIKALKDEVDTLKTENKELRERLEKLEALLEKLV